MRYGGFAFSGEIFDKGEMDMKHVHKDILISSEIVEIRGPMCHYSYENICEATGEAAEERGFGFTKLSGPGQQSWHRHSYVQ